MIAFHRMVRTREAMLAEGDFSLTEGETSKACENSENIFQQKPRGWHETALHSYCIYQVAFQ